MTEKRKGSGCFRTRAFTRACFSSSSSSSSSSASFSLSALLAQCPSSFSVRFAPDFFYSLSKLCSFGSFSFSFSFSFSLPFRLSHFSLLRGHQIQVAIADIATT